MGIDIHSIIQIKRSDTHYETVEDLPIAFSNGYRNSEWFEFLQSISNSNLFLVSIGEWFPEGVDEDGEMQYRAVFGEKKPMGYYGDGWINMGDINEAIARFQRQMSVPRKWWDTFVSLGGKLPSEMKVANDYCGEDRVYFCVEGEMGLYSDWFWDDGILETLLETKKEMLEIMEKYDVKDWRDMIIVFNFDR